MENHKEFSQMTKEELLQNVKDYEWMIKESNKMILDFQTLATRYEKKWHIRDVMLSAIEIEKQRQKGFYQWRIDESKKELKKY